jgi:hypothetical protein
MPASKIPPELPELLEFSDHGVTSGDQIERREQCDVFVPQ